MSLSISGFCLSLALAGVAMLLAVNGTLMRGLELNGNLVAAGATFVRETRTAPAYRLWSIADRHPAMVRVRENGAKVAVEIWDVPAPGIAEILAKEPPGLSVGKVMLEDGAEVLGAGRADPGGRTARDHLSRRMARVHRYPARGTEARVNDLTTIASYVDHAAPLMGLTLTPEQREGVIKNLAMTFEVAQLVMEFPLPDEVDAAPVFEA